MNFNGLVNNIQYTHELLHTSVAKAINLGMTVRNWLIGYYIVEYEQKGQDRAGYGDNILNDIAKETNVKGLSATNLKVFRQFYRIYPEIGQTVSDVFNSVVAPNGISLIGRTVSDQSNEDAKDQTKQNLPADLANNITGVITQIQSVEVPNKE